MRKKVKSKWKKNPKRKNHKPTSYWGAEDRCPNCGEPCNADKDLDEMDYCNLCREY